MKPKILMSAILVLTLMLAACAPQAATVTKPTSVPSAKPPVPVHTATAAPTTKPSNTPTQPPSSTPTPIASLPDKIVISDQAIKLNTVMVNMVVAQKPGWVVIFADQNGQPGTVLGYAAIPAGTSNDIKVSIDAAKSTSQMIAELHIDAGKIGTFEYPGPDVPAKNGVTNVMTVFNKVTAAVNPKGLLPE